MELLTEVCPLQADRLCEEAHNVSSDRCMWVSSELKRARSLVRIAEILQSTVIMNRGVCTSVNMSLEIAETY